MFALISAGAVAYVAPDKFTVHPSLIWVDLTGITPVPDVGWTYAGGMFVAPATDPAAAARAIRAAAQTALDASDLTMLRCVENAAAVPAEWRTYRAALRVIVGTGAGPLPTRPAYPTGT